MTTTWLLITVTLWVNGTVEESRMRVFGGELSCRSAARFVAPNRPAADFQFMWHCMPAPEPVPHG